MSKYNALIKKMYGDSPEELYQEKDDIEEGDRIALINIQERSELSDLFFSTVNK